MEKESKKFNIKPFYKTADSLLRARIKTIDDVKNFYIGVNNLASEISSNQNFINEAGSIKYSDNIKLREGVNYILAYGQVIEKSKLFVKKSLKKVKLNAFLDKNPRERSEIIIKLKEAEVYFYNLKQEFEKYKKDQAEKDEITGKEMESLRNDIKKHDEEIKAIRDAKFIKQIKEDINIGPLSLKNGSVYYGKEYLKLTSQIKNLCVLFMQASKDIDWFVSDDSIREVLNAKDDLSRDGIEKVVSKLRCILRGKNKAIRIERRDNKGYMPIFNKIR